MLTQKRKDQLVNLCRKIVKIPSLSGKEKKVANVLEKHMKKLGFDDVKIDKYGSVIGHIKGKQKGKTILFDGHIDTVDVSDENLWTKDPFGAEIEDGKIYGRGSSDMKGSLSAMIVAASSFAKDTKKQFKGDIYVSCSVHEECFEGVACRAISEFTKPDYVVIGEASGLNLKRGQRGRAEIIVETKGQTAHSSSPEVGKNAVYHMVKIIDALRYIELINHEVLGKGILELTDIISKPYPGASVVPNLCRVTYDRRTLTGETKKSVIRQIEDVIRVLKEKNPHLEAEVYLSEGEDSCWTGEKITAQRFFPAWLFEKDHEFVKKALKGLQSAGLDPDISHYSFCTNGSHFAGEKGIPTIGFGPSDEHLAHIIDEYIEIEQLYKGCRGFYGIMKQVLD